MSLRDGDPRSSHSSFSRPPSIDKVSASNVETFESVSVDSPRTSSSTPHDTVAPSAPSLGAVTSVVVLLAAVGLLVFVFYWTGRHGGRRGPAGTSLRRGPRAHTTARGQPKRSYASREDAEAQSRKVSGRDGTPMSVYRCDTCGKWHVGH